MARSETVSFFLGSGFAFANAGGGDGEGLACQACSLGRGGGDGDGPILCGGGIARSKTVAVFVEAFFFEKLFFSCFAPKTK